MCPPSTGPGDPVEPEVTPSDTARAVRSLPARWQEALDRADGDHLEPEEIASRMGMSPASVRSILGLARETVRDTARRAAVARASGSGDPEPPVAPSARPAAPAPAAPRAITVTGLETVPSGVGADPPARQAGPAVAVPPPAGAAPRSTSPGSLPSTSTASPQRLREPRRRVALTAVLVGLAAAVVLAAAIPRLPSAPADSSIVIAAPDPGAGGGTGARSPGDSDAPATRADDADAAEPAQPDTDAPEASAPRGPGHPGPGEPVSPTSPPDAAVDPASPARPGSTAPARDTQALPPVILRVDTAAGLVAPRLSGSAEPGARVTVSAGTAATAATTAGADGSWAVQVDGLPAGGSRLAVVQTDAAGNTSAPASVHVELATPSISVLRLTGIVLGSSVQGVPGSTVHVLVDGVHVATSVIPASGTESALTLSWIDPWSEVAVRYAVGDRVGPSSAE